MLAGPVLAADYSWDYDISETDTIDLIATTARVDTEDNEIILPRYAPHTAAFWPDGSMDYAVLHPDKVVHYSYDGTDMVENTILEVAPLTNPLGLIAPNPYPDVVVSDDNSLWHYGFSGSDMSSNPALSAAGLAGVAAIGAREQSKVGIVDGEIEYYRLNGSSMQRMVGMEPDVTNPIDVALFPDSNVMVVLEENQARFFATPWSTAIEIPWMRITGLTSPKGIAVAGGTTQFEVSIIDERELKHYSFSGLEMVYNSTLSVTDGLYAPSSVTLRAGSRDKIIVDGDQVKYYEFKDGQLVHNENLSKTVKELYNVGLFWASAVVQTNAQVIDRDIDHVRVRASQILPRGTSITWSVTANDGLDWQTSWRAIHDDEGARLELFTGGTWQEIGVPDHALPEENNTDLWTSVESGRKIKWKAVLETTDPKNTPRIKTIPAGDVAVRWDVDTAPNPPIVGPKPVPEIGKWYNTTSPTFGWTFADADPGHFQTKYRLVINNRLTGGLVYDSGIITSSQPKHTVPYFSADPPKYEPGNMDNPPETPRNPTTCPSRHNGRFWEQNSYQYLVRVNVWDNLGVPSGFCEPVDFYIAAFERPRIIHVSSYPSIPNPRGGEPDTIPAYSIWNGLMFVDYPPLSPRQEPPKEHLPKEITDITDADFTEEMRHSHRVVFHGMATPEEEKDDMYLTKAGAKVRVLVDVVGPVKDVRVRFPYLSSYAKVKPALEDDETVGVPINIVNDSYRSRWLIEFWTAASLDACPTGTIVGMEWDAVPDVPPLDMVPPPEFEKTTLETPEWSRGIIKTKGSIYEDWSVVLIGKDE